jgi:hypothetical protein
MHAIKTSMRARKLLKKLAGTTRLELATSAVTGQRSNQLNYVPSFVLDIARFRLSTVGQTKRPDNLISLTDDRPVVIFVGALPRVPVEYGGPPNCGVGGAVNRHAAQ